MSQYRKLTWRHQLLRSVRLILEDYGGVAELDHIKKIVLVRQYELASSKKILNASKAEEQNLRLEACNLDELLDNLPEERWHEYKSLRQRQKSYRDQLNTAYQITAEAQSQVDLKQREYDEIVEKRFHEEFRVSERKTNLGNRALILSVIGNILIFVTSKGYFDAQRDNRLRDMMNAKVEAVGAAASQAFSDLKVQVLSATHAEVKNKETKTEGEGKVGIEAVVDNKDESLDRKVDLLIKSQNTIAKTVSENRAMLIGTSVLILLCCIVTCFRN